MGEFLALLLSYYTCDAAAAVTQMGFAERMACVETYEDVKTYFAPGFELAPEGTTARIEQMQSAYLAFKDWEEANPETVTELRQTAMDQVMEAAY